MLENVFFWRFQGVSKLGIDVKWVNSFMTEVPIIYKSVH